MRLVLHLGEAESLHRGSGALVGGPDRPQQIAGGARRKLAALDQRQHLRQARRRDRPVGPGAALLELARDVVAHPVRRRSRQRRRSGDDGLEVVGEPADRDQVAGLGGAQAERVGQARAPYPGHFRERRTQAREARRRKVQHRQVGLGKIAIVVRRLLAAQRFRAAGVGVEAARLLGHGLALVEERRLAGDFVLDGARHVLERVEVLDLDLGPELGLFRPLDRDVGIAAQRALLHVAVARAGEHQELMEAAQIVLGLRRVPDFRLGDDLDERHSAAIEVDQADVAESAPAGPVVQELAGVLLEVQTMDANGARVLGERQDAALGERPVELADLISLRKVGVEVVLARENGEGGDLAAERERQRRGEVDRRTVQERQGPRIAEADGADQGIGIGAEPVLAPAEDLAAGLQVDVHFQPDDRLPCRHGASVSQRLRPPGREVGRIAL